MTRDDAFALLKEHTKSDSLLKHALAVEAAMRHYAVHFGADPELWALTGLLHDMDYERWPNSPDHTREGARLLRERGVDEEVVGAILSHAEWNWDEYPLDRPLRKALFAVDELCGFITAVAYVRPEKLAGMTASSVRKKMKQNPLPLPSSARTSSRALNYWGSRSTSTLRTSSSLCKPPPPAWAFDRKFRKLRTPINQWKFNLIMPPRIPIFQGLSHADVPTDQVAEGVKRWAIVCE